jgi:hypothetical protein
MLPSVVEVLEWRETPFLLTYLQNSHRILIDRKLDELFRTNSSAVTHLVASWRSLPETAQDRMRMAPETINHLHKRLPESLSFLQLSVVAERRMSGMDDDKPGALWTALGDAYLPPVKNRNPRIAPRLVSGLPVDGVSPHAERALAIDPDLTRLPTPAECDEAVQKLDDAMETIGAVAQPALDLIVATTRVVVLGAGSGPNQAFSSFSHRRWLGRSGLGNAQLPNVTISTLCDALVHEAIHSFLYLIEEHYPLLAVSGESAGVKLLSPWTGRLLSLRSFVHAIFVWFGLWQFWRRAFPAVSAPQAQALMRAAEIGFHDHNLLDQLRGVDHLITDQARLAATLPTLVVHGAAVS